MILLLLACRAPFGGDTSEAPYADCPITDTSDCDGDGASGADDCDDHEPAVTTPSAEVGGDGVDNDCDGRVDEQVVCAKGGDYPTLTEGIAGAPDGGVLELCPGRYEEPIELRDKSLTIEGGGEEAADVQIVVDGYDPQVWASGDDAVVVVRRVAISDQDEFDIENSADLTIDDVEACANATVTVRNEDPRHLLIQRSRFCATAEVDLEAYSGEVEVFENLFSGGLSLGVTGAHAERVHARNNLVSVDFAVWITMDGGSGVVLVEHNTAVTTRPGGVNPSRYIWAPEWEGEVTLSNNVYASLAREPWVMEFELLYEVPADCSDLYPDRFGPELISGFSEVSAICRALSSYASEYDVEQELSVDTLGEVIEGDPALESTWFLGTGSAAIDAGSDEDPDGTPGDLGAFGGEHGDWWKEVAWLSD